MKSAFAILILPMALSLPVQAKTDSCPDQFSSFKNTRAWILATSAMARGKRKPAPGFEKPALLNQNYYLIGGELRRWNGAFEEVHSPIRVRGKSGRIEPAVLGYAPKMSAQAGLEAYEAARTAWNNGQGIWAMTPLLQRIEVMEQFANQMQDRRDEIARWLVWEIAKPIPDAQSEVDRTIQFIRDTLKNARVLAHQESQPVQVSATETAFVNSRPLGVIPIFAPYNYPLNETFTSLIPALLFGNNVVLKPAKWGILALQPLLEIFQRLFPAGTVNVIYGDGREVFNAIREKGGYEGFAFIGGEGGAKAILGSNPTPHTVDPFLGLGAKNMLVVTPSANVDLAVKIAVAGATKYLGQRCTAAKMLIIHASVYDAFMKKFTAAVDELSIGLPTQGNSYITPSPDPDMVQNMTRHVNQATSLGATIANHPPGQPRNGFFPFVVLENVTSAMSIYQVEQFGPVIPTMKYSDPNEPLQWQIQSKYGQQAVIIGNPTDPSVQTLAGQLQNQVQTVNINLEAKRVDNLPFGSRGESGQGEVSNGPSGWGKFRKTVVLRVGNPN